MRPLLLLLTFTESFATVLLERGLYFFTQERLHFSEAENLALALLMGTLYVAGATWSHRVSAAWTEKRVLAGTVAGLMLLHLAMGAVPERLMIWVGFGLIGLLTGMKWPVIESYVTAGATPRQTLRIVGSFNIIWASAVPLALVLSGPLLASAWPASLIFGAAAIHFTTLLLLPRLPARPHHLAADHPERPSPATVLHYRRLLASARWSMLGSYAMLFLLAPLMPAIFVNRLGYSLQVAPGLSSLVDGVRWLVFVGMTIWVGWRGRFWPLALSIAALPAGFLLILLGSTSVEVMAGQVLFGVAAALTYYAALYHALVLNNASVEAGGAHEALIGLGFALGPAIGLVGIMLQRAMPGEVVGMLVGVAPLLLLCGVGAARPLLRR